MVPRQGEHEGITFGLGQFLLLFVPNIDGTVPFGRPMGDICIRVRED